MFISESTIHSLPAIRYHKSQDQFYLSCKKKIDRYFKEKDISPYANYRMMGKSIFLITLLISTYTAMFWFQPTGAILICLFMLFHFTIFLIAVGIAHDGTHDAYSSKKWVNKVMGKVFDFIGVNSYLWDFNHIKSHHNAPNIPIFDSAIFSFPLIRLHPRAEYRWFHRYQHYYIFAIYSLSTLFKVFVFDFFSFARNRIGFIYFLKHSKGQLTYLLGTKAFVFSYSLFIPLVFLEAPIAHILTGFFVGHMISGVALGLIFMVTHLHQHTTWPEPDDKGMINNSFARHIMETTSDFAVHNPIVTWISGGLNIHVVHHLFPRISQIHLSHLVDIVKSTAEEFDVTYHIYPNTWSALKSHLKIIKMLGRRDAVTVPQGKPVWL